MSGPPVVAARWLTCACRRKEAQASQVKCQNRRTKGRPKHGETKARAFFSERRHTLGFFGLALVLSLAFLALARPGAVGVALVVALAVVLAVAVAVVVVVVLVVVVVVVLVVVVVVVVVAVIVVAAAV